MPKLARIPSRQLGDAQEFYRGTGRHDCYSIRAVDEQGKVVPDPVPRTGMGSSIGLTETSRVKNLKKTPRILPCEASLPTKIE